MVSISSERGAVYVKDVRRLDNLTLLGMAAAIIVIHLATNNRYGFHRDELQFLTDARHLDWGFVPYPPFTAAVEWLGLKMFGLSMVGLRLFSVLAQAAVVAIAGLMARELGGGRLAQIATAIAVATSPLPLFEGTEFQYTSFDYLWWVLAAYFIIRLLNSGDPRWWLAVGAAVGLGLETKYSILFYVAGILTGLVLTRARRFLLTAWFWAAAAVALLLFIPNLVWQVHHEFISYHFLHHIHARDVREGRATGFLQNQLWVCTNFYSVPLWIAGLISFFRNPRYRMLGWMYVVSFALFYFGKGRFYYLAAAYPPLIAMGASVAEHWLPRLSFAWRRVVTTVFFLGIAGSALYSFALVLPIATSGPLMRFALNNNDTLREEFGWDDLVRTVAGIRDSLPPPQQQSVRVLTGNYGEAGAIEMLGPAYHLAPPVGMTNSAWLRGYPDPPPTTLIVVGFSRQAAENAFTNCRLAGHNGNRQGIRNEESEDHPDIFLCGPPRQSWPEFWKDHQAYG